MHKCIHTIFGPMLILICFLFIGPVQARTSKQDGGDPTDRLLPADISPHFNAKYCLQCHEQLPDKTNHKVYLKSGFAPETTCRCHFTSNIRCPHPSGIRPAETQDIHVPSDFPLKNGEITCSTCHDIYQQCRQQALKDSFLRGNPYFSRSDICFRCHNKKNYEKLNPHIQLDAKGVVQTETCLFCHVAQPIEKKSGSEKTELIGAVELLCRRCHVISGNHSGNFNHMVKPSAKLLARMQAMEKQFAIKLPLDEKGALTCATCHNPHDKGILSDQNPAAKGAGSMFRHRLPDRMCIECHLK